MFNRLLIKYYVDESVTLNPGAGGAAIAVDTIGGISHELVKVEFGPDGSATQVSAANPLPVTDAVAEAALASIAAEDFATQTTLAAILAKISADPATQTTLAAILAKLIANPATDTLQTTGNTTLASILAKIIAAPSTEAKQDTGNTSLAAILAKIIAAPATEFKQDNAISLLSSIDAGTAAALGQAAMADSVPVVIAPDQSVIPVTVSGIVTVGAVDNTQLYSNSLVATGAIAGLNTTGYASVIAQISDIWSGSMWFEGSNDNATWEELMVTSVDELSMQDVITENGTYQIKTTAKWVRLNVLSLQSGEVSVLILGRTVPGISGADLLSLAMDKVNGTPLYVEETATKKDIRNALIPSDAPAPIYGSAAATNGVLFLVDTTGYQSVTVQCTTFGSNVTIQMSHDGSTWVNLLGFNSAITQSSALITAAGIWEYPATGKLVRGLMAGANFTNCLVYLRQRPANPFNLSVGATMNLQAVSGTSVVVPTSITSTGSAGTLAGLVPVGSGTTVGSTTVPNPIIIGGREAPSDGALGGKVRTLLTDTIGRAIVTGDISASQSTQNVKSVPTQDQSQFEGQSMIEIMAQILLELRINNQYMSDLPLVLRGQSGSFDEPQQFRNDNSLFAIQ